MTIDGKKWALVLLPIAFLTACATAPSGPRVAVMPGSGKSFDQFRYDDIDCRQYARDMSGRTPDEVSANSGVTSAVIGTLLGAAAGAAVNGGRGAGVGAGAGLLIGGAAGAGAAQQSASNAQQSYDISYEQCMYAKGHRVPVAAGMGLDRARGYYAPPAPAGSYPPPPAGNPPPPPPRYGY